MREPQGKWAIAMPLCLLLAACQQQPPDRVADAASAGSMTDTRPPVIAAAAAFDDQASPALPGDHASTRTYRIAIKLPRVPAGEKPLAQALRASADHAKRAFLDTLPDPGSAPESGGHPAALTLDFTAIARTDAFTSVHETGAIDSGGAHPIPVAAAFVLDRKAQRLIGLDDLFSDPPSARIAIANYARNVLLKRFMAMAPGAGEGTAAALREWQTRMLGMLDEGTRPIAVNYSAFMVRAGATAATPSPGLTVIFPPYQVAPYVYGTQAAEVPASVFDRYLKPAYRGAFDRASVASGASSGPPSAAQRL